MSAALTHPVLKFSNQASGWMLLYVCHVLECSWKGGI